MKNGQCPKCGAKEIYSGDQVSTKSGPHNSNSIPLSVMHAAPLDNYVCGKCGYVESYISRQKDFEFMKRKWPLVM